METIEQILQDIEELAELYRQKVADGELPDVKLDDITTIVRTSEAK